MKKRVFLSAVTAAAMMLSCGSFKAFAAEADTATTSEEHAETASYSAETIIGVWEGSYVGNTGGSNDTLVERTILFSVDQCDEKGTFSGIANISSSENERYFFKGSFDFQTGGFKLKGTDWIINVNGWGFSEFNGNYDPEEKTITGLLADNKEKAFTIKKASDECIDYSIDISKVSRNWYGEYDGYWDDDIVRRNIKFSITEITDNGEIKGTGIISPSDKADAQFAVDGSYYFKGNIDEKSGKIYIKGNEWIERPNNFDFAVFNGIITDGTIDGYTEKGIWKMESTDVLKGDLNFDNLLTVADLVALQKYLLNNNDFNKSLFYYADMNDDEKVNAFDLILLRQAVANKPNP